MTTEGKEPGVVRRAAGKVAGHVQARREFKVPTWLIYVIGVLGVVGGVYGGIQQARVWRWKRLLQASQVRIAELTAEKQQIALETTKKIAQGEIKVSKKKLVSINKKLKQIEKNKLKIQKDTARMNAIELMNAFRGEGFKKRKWEKE